jgi:hypothetical protein
MRRTRPIEMVVIGCILLAGAFFFGWMIVLSDAVPTEYRSASPGFGWSWDFDYQTATRSAGRQGEAPWPWPAKVTGSRLILPLNQPLLTDGLAMTYRGMTATGGFRLDVVIHDLDPNVVYPREFGVEKARHGFMVADRHFRLEKITPRYLRMRSNPP